MDIFSVQRATAEGIEFVFMFGEQLTFLSAFLQLILQASFATYANLCASQLEGVDVEAALERYASKGDWQKAIAIAEKKVWFDQCLNW